MDVSLESKSLPSVGNSRKSYLQVTSQRLARGKLVHLHGRRSLALPSVGPGEFGDLDNKNLKKNISKCRLQISGSTKDHFAGENVDFGLCSGSLLRWHSLLNWSSQLKLWALMVLGGVFANLPSFRKSIVNLKAILKLGGDFAAISKLGGHFAEKWHFRKPFLKLGAFRIHFKAQNCEMRVTVLRNGTRNTLLNEALAAKLGVFTLWDFAAAKQLRNGGSYAAKWHSCAKSGFAVAKIFAERGLRLRTGFAAKCRFRRGCEISQTPVFPLFLLCFHSDFAPKDFLQFLCNSS
uniref:Uncharacterized protein n=1 Tax=Vitis vinifera TaxID=29760 RepID=A5AHL6_VITVI|nr:hypothetical protein VITISV_022343 [Vitis vinifera]